MKNYFVIGLLSIFMLSACSTAMKRKLEVPSKPVVKVTEGAYLDGDGPSVDTPSNLDVIPDAVVRNEPLHRYANRAYVALGIPYAPIAKVGDFKQRGVASWYGKKFHGQPTSSGEKYDMYAMTAAHPTLPIPSYARVTNIANQKSVVVRINDRGPFHAGRVIDLSYAAAFKLDLLRGVAPVLLERITFGEIRSGAWQRMMGSAVPSQSHAPPLIGAGAELTPATTTQPVACDSPASIRRCAMAGAVRPPM